METSRGYAFPAEGHSHILFSLSVKANVLVDETCHARLADFGLLTVTSDPANLFPSSSYGPGGTGRWMSPERILPDDFGFKTSRPSKSSDCYSLGMVIYEVISGKVPFHDDRDPTVLVKVLKGERPRREEGFADNLWNMMERCWMPQPSDRPSVEGVLQCLEVCSNQAAWETEENPRFGDHTFPPDEQGYYPPYDSNAHSAARSSRLEFEPSFFLPTGNRISPSTPHIFPPFAGSNVLPPFSEHLHTETSPVVNPRADLNRPWLYTLPEIPTSGGAWGTFLSVLILIYPLSSSYVPDFFFTVSAPLIWIPGPTAEAHERWTGTFCPAPRHELNTLTRHPGFEEQSSQCTWPGCREKLAGARSCKRHEIPHPSQRFREECDCCSSSSKRADGLSRRCESFLCFLKLTSIQCLPVR